MWYERRPSYSVDYGIFTRISFQLKMIHWCLNKAELALSKCGQSKDRVQRKDTKRADKKSSLRKPRSADETGTNNIIGEWDVF